jgi:hypothetical protein
MVLTSKKATTKPGSAHILEAEADARPKTWLTKGHAASLIKQQKVPTEETTSKTGLAAHSSTLLQQQRCCCCAQM